MINEFRCEYSFLSNFSDHKVTYEGLTFLNAEAAFQAAKSVEMPVRRQFTDLPPNKAKALGRRIKLRADWEEVKDSIMREILSAKFSTPAMWELLKSTGTQTLVEGNVWHDNYWGDCSCPKCKDTAGKNMLGKLLMELRDQL